MKNIVTLLVIASATVACDKPGTSASGDAAVTSPDDTNVNERDRHSTTTPIDQGNGQADLDTTANIRKALMGDDSLSTTAKDVKVVTKNGNVTLRGPVKNDVEKKAVESKAIAAAGGHHVDNQLDVEAK